MATTNSAAVQLEHAHNHILRALQEHGSPENAERVEYLENLGIYLSSNKSPVHLSSAQSVMIAALVEIIRGQGRRIAALENPAPAAAAVTKRAPKK